MEDMSRSRVVAGLEEALEPIGDGAVVGIGGSITADHPMSLIRGLARRGARELTVVAPTAGLDVDLLIAAGCVRRVVTSYVGAEGLAPVGPAFRAAVEAGDLELSEFDEAQCAMGLRAAAHRLPFLPWRGGVGTSMPEVNRDLVEFEDPLRGERLLAVPALELDFALIHAETADCYGNAQIAGTGHMDPLIAGAARRVVVQVERLVPNEQVRRDPSQTRFWPETVVVRAPWGTHPYSGLALLADEAHLSEYADAARAAATGETGALEAYLERYVLGPAGHEDYLEQVGIRRIAELLPG